MAGNADSLKASIAIKYIAINTHQTGATASFYVNLAKNTVLSRDPLHNSGGRGAALRIQTEGLEAFAAQLLAKRYGNARPAVQNMPCGTQDMSISDPFGNRLTFLSDGANDQ